MKKFIFIMLALAVILQTVSCGTEETSSGGKTYKSEGDFDKYSYELNLTVPGSSGIVLKDEEAKVTAVVKNFGKFRAKKGTITLTFESIYGKVENTSYDFDETTEKNREFTFSLPVKTNKNGYWAVYADVTLDKEENKLDTIVKSYAVVDKPYNYGAVDAKSFFGVMDIQDTEAAQRIGIKTNRVSLYWRYIENPAGVYNWLTYDDIIDRSIASNINVVLNIQPEIHLPTAVIKAYDVQSAEDILKPEIMAAYKKFIRESILRYKDKVEAVEIVNEADMTWEMQPKLSRERMGVLVAEVMAEGYKIVKELAPNMPLHGLSVSERGFYKEGDTSTNAILKNAKGRKLADALTLHPYSDRQYVSASTKHFNPEEYGLYPHLLNSVKYGREHGINRFLISEIGYAVKMTDPLLSEYRKTHAGLLMRQIITSKAVPEMEKCLVFDMYLHFDMEGGYTYSMFSGPDKTNTYPNPAAFAFAECAYFLHDSQIVKSFNPGLIDYINAHVFKSESRKTATAVLWRGNKEATKISIKGIPELKVFDLYGKEIASGSDEFNAAHDPVYVTAPIAQLNKLVSAVEAVVKE